MATETKKITSRNQCYNCKHRGELNGSAHSKCNRFISMNDFDPPKVNEHGVESGWYVFPFNYDPVWQESLCEGFEPNDN